MDNIYQKLQAVRVKITEQCTKKSGKNGYAGFEYFELKDFLPQANKAFAEVGLCPVFTIEARQIDKNPNTITETGIVEEIANLRIYQDKDTYIDFATPIADVVMGGKNNNPIQNLGAQHTYLKRYLYMNALELSESDMIDATAGKEKPAETKPTLATPKQVETIMNMYDDENLEKIKEYYQVEKIEDLTVVQASQAIKAKKGQ